MNSHYFKRIFESIITRKKDSILIFFIVLILSTFIIISMCISNLGTNISNAIKNEFEVEIYMDNVSFTDDSKTNIKNKIIKEIYENKNELLVNEDDLVIMNMSFESMSNLSYDEFIEVYDEYENITKEISYVNIETFSVIDEEKALDEGFLLIDGTYLKENDVGCVLVNSSMYVDGKEVEVGDTLVLTINNINYEYLIIGTFSYYNDQKMLGGNFFYDDSTKVIMTQDDLLELCIDNDIPMKLNNITLSFTNGYRYDDMYKRFNTFIGNILYKNNTTISNSLQSNIDEYQSMVAPSENMSTLYLIISIVMAIISCLLLSNVVRYINENRIKEYTILLSMGQNKLLSIISFGIEILIITNIAITLALPIGINIAKSISNDLLKSNLKRQERLAYISGSDKDIDIFKTQDVLYENYKIEVSSNDVLEIYLLNNGLVIVSCLLVFIIIYKSKPRELLLHD